MISQESQEISKRFFQALYELKDRKIIRGKQTFTARYEIDRRNLNKVEAHPDELSVQLAWLSYLIKDYNISARWLMTGEGEMFALRNDKQVK